MKKEPKLTSINVRIDEELKNRVAALAEVQGITISEMVRDWYAECVERYERVLAQELKEFENLNEQNS